jgi:Zn finger protein HypA/HybF involved in hydrogenase expression
MKRIPKIDGFGVAERKAVRSAVRLVWHRSLPRRLALKRATDAEGYICCEQCGQRTPRHHVDHIEALGDVESDGYLVRLFVPSSALRVLCPPCHRPKTLRERKTKRKAA